MFFIVFSLKKVWGSGKSFVKIPADIAANVLIACAGVANPFTVDIDFGVELLAAPVVEVGLVDSDYRHLCFGYIA